MSPLLAGITWLILFQCAGEAIAYVLGIPIPGPVLGMVLLFLALRWRKRIPDGIGIAADGLAKHLSLLFVPAGVGVIAYTARLESEGVAIVAALVISAPLVLAAAALTFNALARSRGRADRSSDATP
jgi:holin-like protein